MAFGKLDNGCFGRWCFIARSLYDRVRGLVPDLVRGLVHGLVRGLVRGPVRSLIRSLLGGLVRSPVHSSPVFWETQLSFPQTTSSKNWPRLNSIVTVFSGFTAVGAGWPDGCGPC